MVSLASGCGKFFKDFYDFKDENKNCLVRVLDKFCKTGKKDDAFSVYFCFCEIYGVFGKGYDSMKKLLELLSDHEYHSGGLLTKHRDHYSHSVYVFALGLALYAADKKLGAAFGDASEFLRLWGMTALFHDVGYPFQLAHEQIKRYTSDLWGEDNRDNPHVAYVNTEKFLSIPDGCGFGAYADNVNELFARSIAEKMGYDEKCVYEILRGKVASARFMDHAYFGAVMLFKQIAENADNDPAVLDVLTAILMHNSFNKYDMQGNSVRLSVENHPYAYLLMLCDDLQNWDRQAFGYTSKKDPLAWEINLELSEGEIGLEYVFDSFKMDLPGKSEPVANRNALQLEEDAEGGCAFVRSITEFVEPHAVITAKAKEKKKDKQLHKYTSADNFVNLCDFAKAIHKCYQNTYGGESFEDLSLEFKLSNIEQAKSYAYKLELINCFYSDRELDYPALKEFTSGTEAEELKEQKDDLGFLAREEHLRWVREKLDAGWHYGTSYIDNGIEDRELRNRLKEHKDLVPYDALDEAEREKDALMIKNMIPFLYEQGHCIRIYRYRHGRKPDLEIACIGHRILLGDRAKYKARIKRILKKYQRDYRVTVRSKFAYGSDLLIAECAAELGITLKAVLARDYEEFIEDMKKDAEAHKAPLGAEDVLKMRHLLAQAVVCRTVRDRKSYWGEANVYMINRCQKVIAIWDGVKRMEFDSTGKPYSRGGTYHLIDLAHRKGLKDGKDIHIIRDEEPGVDRRSSGSK